MSDSLNDSWDQIAERTRKLAEEEQRRIERERAEAEERQRLLAQQAAHAARQG